MQLQAPREFDENDQFFRRANKNNWGNNRPKASLFKPKDEKGLSVDWSYLTTPEESAARAKPEEGPIRLVVLKARLIWELELAVEYSPKGANRSHCDILGELLTDGSPEGIELRAKLVRGYDNVLGPFDESTNVR